MSGAPRAPCSPLGVPGEDHLRRQAARDDVAQGPRSVEHAPANIERVVVGRRRVSGRAEVRVPRQVGSDDRVTQSDERVDLVLEVFLDEGCGRVVERRRAVGRLTAAAVRRHDHRERSAHAEARLTGEQEQRARVSGRVVRVAALRAVKDPIELRAAREGLPLVGDVSGVVGVVDRRVDVGNRHVLVLGALDDGAIRLARSRRRGRRRSRRSNRCSAISGTNVPFPDAGAPARVGSCSSPGAG